MGVCFGAARFEVEEEDGKLVFGSDLGVVLSD
jgi:hypothetical protein